MKCVIIESPLRGLVTKNRDYLWECTKDCLKKGEAPFASHGLYPFTLNDDDPEERKLGIEAGFAWWPAAERIIFYTDLGWSEGMKAALARAVALGKPFETRSIR